jgi:hypothetical protein
VLRASIAALLGALIAGGLSLLAATPAAADGSAPPPPPPPLSGTTTPVVVAPARADGWACGATCAPCAPCGNRCWSFEATVPIWIPSVSGRFASGSTEVSVDRNFDRVVNNGPKIASSFEFALVGRLDARCGRWIGFLDAFGVRLRQTADFRVNALDAEAKTTAIIGRLAVGYRFLASRRSGGCSPVDLDVFAGVRAYHAGIELSEPALLAFKRTKTWYDPIVGTRADWCLSRRFDLRLTADIGGFSIGSNLSWSITPELVWKVSRRVSIQLGYTWLSVDADLGKDDGRFLYSLDLQGPELSLTYSF